MKVQFMVAESGDGRVSMKLKSMEERSGEPKYMVAKASAKYESGCSMCTCKENEMLQVGSTLQVGE